MSRSLSHIRSGEEQSFEWTSSCGAVISNYTVPMARGWESKSVEAQQSEAAQPTGPPKPLLTSQQKANLQKKEGLMLQRSRVAQQLESATNPQYQKMLQAALADLDSRISVLG